MFYAALRNGRWIDLFDMIIKLNGHEVAYYYGYLANAETISADKPVSHPVNSEDHKTLHDALAARGETGRFHAAAKSG